MSTTMQRLSGSISSPSVLTGRLGIAFMPAPTGDATALVTDILAPKTAYIATGKVVGTCTFDADTSDGTAAEGDIRTGMSAYVSGVKVTGTSTFDADTSDADATAADILDTKTAYVAGAKLTGTLTVGDLLTAGTVEVLTRDGSGYPLTAKHYGAVVYSRQYEANAASALYWRTLTNVNFVDALLQIKPRAFLACAALALTSLPSTLTSIEAYAFNSCAALALTSLPIGVATLTSGAFSGCSGLTTLDCPGVTTVEGSTAAFGPLSGCTSLTSATLGSIGNAVTSILVYAFSGCTQMGLTITIYVTPGAQPLANSPWGATNATIVYRSAVDGSVL